MGSHWRALHQQSICPTFNRNVGRSSRSRPMGHHRAAVQHLCKSRKQIISKSFIKSITLRPNPHGSRSRCLSAVRRKLAGTAWAYKPAILKSSKHMTEKLMAVGQQQKTKRAPWETAQHVCASNVSQTKANDVQMPTGTCLARKSIYPVSPLSLLFPLNDT